MKLDDQYCKSLDCSYNDLYSDINTIQKFINALNKDNYFLILHDFITIFAVDDFLTDILYDNQFFNNFSLFLNKDIEDIDNYINYDKYRALSDENVENQWFKVDMKNRVINRLDLDDVIFILNSLIDQYKKFNI